MVHILLSHSKFSVIDKQDDKKNTALHLAAKYHHSSLCNILINHNVFQNNYALINARNIAGLTAKDVVTKQGIKGTKWSKISTSKRGKKLHVQSCGTIQNLNSVNSDVSAISLPVSYSAAKGIYTFKFTIQSKGGEYCVGICTEDIKLDKYPSEVSCSVKFGIFYESNGSIFFKKDNKKVTLRKQRQKTEHGVKNLNKMQSSQHLFF